MADKHLVPRWRYQRVEIPALSSVWADPTVFSNTDVWPWDLRWLSLVGTPELTERGPFDVPTGGIGVRLALKAMISQWSTINLVPLSAHSMMPHLRRPMSLMPGNFYAHRFLFPHPPILAPDGSIVAQIQNTNYAGGTRKNFSLVLNGYRNRSDGSREPDQISGIYEEDMEAGVADTMDVSDLYNDGETDFHIREMLLCNPFGAGGSIVLGNEAAWRINPATGVPWMPQAELIPQGNIAPFNFPYTLFDTGPRAYEFPRGTLLRRRQRLDLQVTNLSDVAQVADFALFGLLEVS